MELIEGYERFGDATSGPLLPGDRGTIIEMQYGPSGERYENSMPILNRFTSISIISQFAIFNVGIPSVSYIIHDDGGINPRHLFARAQV